MSICKIWGFFFKILEYLTSLWIDQSRFGLKIILKNHKIIRFMRGINNKNLSEIESIMKTKQTLPSCSFLELFPKNVISNHMLPLKINYP